MSSAGNSATSIEVIASSFGATHALHATRFQLGTVLDQEEVASSSLAEFCRIPAPSYVRANRDAALVHFGPSFFLDRPVHVLNGAIGPEWLVRTFFQGKATQEIALTLVQDSFEGTLAELVEKVPLLL